MKNQTLKLFKLQIDEIYNIFKLRDFKKLIWSAVKFLFVILILYVASTMLVNYVRTYGIVFNLEMISIVLLVTQLISLIFATSNIVTTLYFSKNNDILMTMPVTPNQIFLSKMMVIYVKELTVNTICTFPLMLVLGDAANLGGFYPIALIFACFLLPLMPLAIGAFISVPVAKLLAFLKKHTIISTVIIFALVAVGLVVYMNTLGVIANFDLGNRYHETVLAFNRDVLRFGRSNGFFLRVAQGLSSPSSLGWVAMYVGLSLLFLSGAVLIARHFFFKVAMSNYEETSEALGKTKQFKKTSPLVSLLKKEMLTTFRSPGAIFQYFVFALLMPVIVLLYDKLLLSLDVITVVGKMMIAGAHVLVVAMLATLSNIISASAISREGGTFYIIKIAPVDYFTQTAAKVLFNALVTITAVVITGITTLIYGNFLPHSIDPFVVIATTISVVFVSIGHIAISFDLDLRDPTLNWYDPADISSVSANTTKSLLWSMGIALCMCFLVMLFSTTGLVVAPWIVMILMSLGFGVFHFYRLILRVSYRYEEIEI